MASEWHSIQVSTTWDLLSSIYPQSKSCTQSDWGFRIQPNFAFWTSHPLNIQYTKQSPSQCIHRTSNTLQVSHRSGQVTWPWYSPQFNWTHNIYPQSRPRFSQSIQICTLLVHANQTTILVKSGLGFSPSRQYRSSQCQSECIQYRNSIQSVRYIFAFNAIHRILIKSVRLRAWHPIQVKSNRRFRSQYSGLKSIQRI